MFFLCEDDFFFPMTPGFEPTKTTLISGQSVFTRPQSHSDSMVFFSALLTVFFFYEYIKFSVFLYIYMRMIFFSDDTRIRTNEHQAHRRTVYLLFNRRLQKITVRTVYLLLIDYRVTVMTVVSFSALLTVFFFC